MAVARAPGAKSGQLFVHFRGCDRAALDIDQAMGIVAEKSDDPVFDVHRNAVAIFVVERRGDDRAQRRLAEFSDALQGLRDLARFPVQLMLVAHVLVTASAASAKVRARRRSALRGCLQHRNELRFGERFFFAHDPRRDSLALDRERNEDRLAFGASDAFAAKSDVVDHQLRVLAPSDSCSRGG